MTVRQEIELMTVRRKLGEIRDSLNWVMYKSDNLSEKDFNKVREAYGLICKANDNL